MDEQAFSPTAEAIRSVFAFVYGRAPTDQEMGHMLSSNVTAAGSTTSLARRVIACMDRQTFGTPYLIRFGADDLRTVPCGAYDFVVDDADRAVAPHVSAGIEYEPHMAAFFRSQVTPGMRVVDVGANIGVHTMLASSLVGEAGHVYACEPNSENCRLLLLNASRNGASNITVLPVALSGQTGSAFFSPHLGSNGGLLPSAEQTLLSPNCVVVPTMRLDDLVTGPVDLIKIDTEGAEGLVMAGAMATVSRNKPIVVSEFSPEMLSRVSNVDGRDYVAMFETLGYQVMLLAEENRSGHPAPIGDWSAFLDSYGPITRIVDLVFVPLEKALRDRGEATRQPRQSLAT